MPRTDITGLAQLRDNAATWRPDLSVDPGSSENPTQVENQSATKLSVQHGYRCGRFQALDGFYPSAAEVQELKSSSADGMQMRFLSLSGLQLWDTASEHDAGDPSTVIRTERPTTGCAQSLMHGTEGKATHEIFLQHECQDHDGKRS